MNTIQSVLDFFKKEKQYFSPDYSAYTIIPESFCLARLQRCEEAKKTLAEYFKDWAKKPDSQDILEKALAMVCEKKFPSES